MRVVIDTNVFVSSFFGGKPRQIIDLWRDGKLIWCLTRPIVDEYVRVLSRMGLENADGLHALLTLFAEGPNILYSAKTPRITIITEDSDDDKFLEAALALNCTVIISGDKHLLNVGSYMGIQILSPAAFLAEMDVG